MKKIIAFLLTMVIVSILQVNAQAIATDAKLPDTINRTDASGNRIGYWVDKLGETTYKGEYVANKKVKNWIGYYPNNAIFKIEYFNNGLKDGISVQFDRKCKISLIEHYKSGLAHGLTVLYSQYNENPTSETQYTFGKKNGLYRQYYDNTKIQEETMYVNDLKNGPSVWNNKNGQRIAEYNYKDGSFDGVQKTYYENDSLQLVNNYLDNKLSGESKEFFRNGKIKLSGKYVNGQKDGAWTEYNELGKAENVIKYKEGVELNKK